MFYASQNKGSKFDQAINRLTDTNTNICIYLWWVFRVLGGVLQQPENPGELRGQKSGEFMIGSQISGHTCMVEARQRTSGSRDKGEETITVIRTEQTTTAMHHRGESASVSINYSRARR